MSRKELSIMKIRIIRKFIKIEPRFYFFLNLSILKKLRESYLKKYSNKKLNKQHLIILTIKILANNNNYNNLLQNE